MERQTDIAATSSDKDTYTYWLAQLNAYDQAFRAWETRTRKIVKRYRAEGCDVKDSLASSRPTYNILYANISILQPAIYNQPPVPMVERRNNDRDPIGRLASMILQRALMNTIEMSNFDEAIEQARDDRLFGGRATVWERYEAKFGDTIKDASEQDALAEDGTPLRDVSYECSHTEYVAYNDFSHSVAKKWEQVWWVSRKVPMTKQMVKDLLGDKVAGLLKYGGSLDNNKGDETGKGTPVSYVEEIWDKDDKKIRYLSKEYNKGLLAVKEYPYDLQGGFPCPRPCYGITTNETLVPVPDYVMYQDQALDLDILTGRISMLTEACKAAGIVDSDLGITAQKLFQGDDLQITQVKDLAAKYQKGGSAGLAAFMQFTPIEAFANVIGLLQQQKEARLQDIYQITGIGDILRGFSDPSSTATAEQIKSNYANLRLKKMQRSFQTFVRGALRLKAEIICEQFSTETILDMANVEEMRPANMPLPQPDPMTGEMMPDMWRQALEQAVQLLRDDKQRTFRIDIETDSTIGLIEQQDREDMNRFTVTVTGLLQQAIPAIQASPELAPFIKEIVMLNVRQFKVGRQTEGTLEESLDKLVQAASQPKPEQPNPQMLKLQQEGETDKAKLALQQEKQQSEAQVKIQGQQTNAATDIEIERMKLQGDLARIAAEQQLDILRLNQPQVIVQ